MPLHTGFHPPVQWHFVPSMIQQGKTLPVKYGGHRGRIKRDDSPHDDFTTYSHKFPLPIILTKSPTHTIIRIHFLKDIGFLLANHSWHFAIHFLK